MFYTVQKYTYPITPASWGYYGIVMKQNLGFKPEAQVFYGFAFGRKLLFVSCFNIKTFWPEWRGIYVMRKFKIGYIRSLFKYFKGVIEK